MEFRNFQTPKSILAYLNGDLASRRTEQKHMAWSHGVRHSSTFFFFSFLFARRHVRSRSCTATRWSLKGSEEGEALIIFVIRTSWSPRDAVLWNRGRVKKELDNFLAVGLCGRVARRRSSKWSGTVRLVIRILGTNPRNRGSNRQRPSRTAVTIGPFVSLFSFRPSSFFHRVEPKSCRLFGTKHKGFDEDPTTVAWRGEGCGDCHRSPSQRRRHGVCDSVILFLDPRVLGSTSGLLLDQ